MMSRSATRGKQWSHALVRRLTWPTTHTRTCRQRSTLPCLFLPLSLVYTKKNVLKGQEGCLLSSSHCGVTSHLSSSSLQYVSVGQLYFFSGCKCEHRSWVEWHVPSQQLNERLCSDNVWKELFPKWYAHNMPMSTSANGNTTLRKDFTDCTHELPLPKQDKKKKKKMLFSFYINHDWQVTSSHIYNIFRAGAAPLCGPALWHFSAFPMVWSLFWLQASGCDDLTFSPEFTQLSQNCSQTGFCLPWSALFIVLCTTNGVTLKGIVWHFGTPIPHQALRVCTLNTKQEPEVV